MKKLTLENVRVESFATGKAPSGAGTVAAHESDPAMGPAPTEFQCAYNSGATSLYPLACCSMPGSPTGPQ